MTWAVAVEIKAVKENARSLHERALLRPAERLNRNSRRPAGGGKIYHGRPIHAAVPLLQILRRRYPTRRAACSPARALKVSPPFNHFYFIDMDADKTNYLASLCKDRTDVTIHTGDATQHLTQKLLPTIRFEKFNRALCLLDP